MVFLLLIFKLTSGCFSLSSHLFCHQIASVNCCMCLLLLFFFIYIFFVFCFYSFAFVCVCVRSWHASVFWKYSNVYSISSLDEPLRPLRTLRANVAINMFTKKEKEKDVQCNVPNLKKILLTDTFDSILYPPRQEKKAMPAFAKLQNWNKTKCRLL